MATAVVRGTFLEVIEDTPHADQPQVLRSQTMSALKKDETASQCEYVEYVDDGSGWRRSASEESSKVGNSFIEGNSLADCPSGRKDKRDFHSAPAELMTIQALSVKNTFLDVQEVDEDQPLQIRRHTTSALDKIRDREEELAATPEYVSDGAFWRKLTFEDLPVVQGGQLQLIAEEDASGRCCSQDCLRPFKGAAESGKGCGDNASESAEDSASDDSSGEQDDEDVSNVKGDGARRRRHGLKQKDKRREKRRQKRQAERAAAREGAPGLSPTFSATGPKAWEPNGLAVAAASPPYQRKVASPLQDANVKDIAGFLASQMYHPSLMAAAMAALPAAWASAAAAGAAAQLVPGGVSPTPQWCFAPPSFNNKMPVPASHGQTTLMLRNLPNNYTRNMLIDLLNAEGFGGRYDFVYVPHDFKTRAGLGFAFVNLVTPYDAECMKHHLEGFKRWSIPSSKTCTVGWSSEDQQGLAANIQRYRNSSVMHDSVPEECKPVLFEKGMPVPFPKNTRKVWPPSDEYGARARKQ